MRIRHTAHNRSGFTLVEMLVATALVLMIMLIISQALGAATKTFSTLRTAGNLQERNRTAITLMRKDLGSDKFGPPYGSSRGGPRVSDQRADQPGWQTPWAGYFEFSQPGEAGGGASIYEPYANPRVDGEGLTSTRAINHRLRFTVRLPDGPPTDLFAAQFDPGYAANPQANAFVNGQFILYTRWAEVVYWLESSGEQTSVSDPTNKGLDLYTLRRRIRMLPPANVDINMTSAAALQFISSFYISYPNRPKYPDVVAPYIVTPYPSATVTVRLPGPEALNLPDVDWTPTYINANNLPQYVQRMTTTAHPAGEDIVLTDVISFDVKAAWFNNPTFESIKFGSSPAPRVFASTPPNMDEPFSDLFASTLTTQGRAFDTGTRTIPGDPRLAPIDQPDSDQPFMFLNAGNAAPVGTVPSRINLRTMQIKIRIWDPRAEQARQVTIVQEI